MNLSFDVLMLIMLFSFLNCAPPNSDVPNDTGKGSAQEETPIKPNPIKKPTAEKMPNTPVVDDMSFSVGTYNVYYEGYPTNLSTVKGVLWNVREPFIKKILRSANLDVVCFQEITKAAFMSLETALPEYTGRFRQHGIISGKQKLDGIAIFMRRDQFDFVDVKSPAVSEREGWHDIYIFALHKKSSRPVIIATSHFKGGPPPGSDIGDRQVKAMLDVLQKNAEPSSILVAAGDFNRERGDARFTPLLDAGFSEDGSKAFSEIADAKGQPRKIDFIFVKSLQGSLTLSSIEVVQDQNEHASDHVLVATMVRFGQ